MGYNGSSLRLTFIYLFQHSNNIVGDDREIMTSEYSRDEYHHFMVVLLSVPLQRRLLPKISMRGCSSSNILLKVFEILHISIHDI